MRLSSISAQRHNGLLISGPLRGKADLVDATVGGHIGQDGVAVGDRADKARQTLAHTGEGGDGFRGRHSLGTRHSPEGFGGRARGNQQGHCRRLVKGWPAASERAWQGHDALDSVLEVGHDALMLHECSLTMPEKSRPSQPLSPHG